MDTNHSKQKLLTSAELLRKVDARIRQAKHTQEQLEAKIKKFTFLEYLEFSSAHEFEHFKKQKPVTQKDINNVKWELLLAKLSHQNQ